MAVSKNLIYSLSDKIDTLCFSKIISYLPREDICRGEECIKYTKHSCEYLSLCECFPKIPHSHAMFVTWKYSLNCLSIDIDVHPHMILLYYYPFNISFVLKNVGQLSGLKVISNGCFITTDDIFRHCPELTHLHLQNMHIMHIPSNMSCAGLTSLILKTNEIRNISILQNMTTLEYLDLSNNKIDLLSLWDWQLTNLAHLNMSYNAITYMPSTFTNMTRLIYLDLSHNKIILMSRISKMINLTHLNLSHNKISQCINLEKLTKLRCLFLNNNRFSAMPDGIGELVDLQEFNMGNNRLTNMSQDITKLKKMKKLCLEHNNIEQIPRDIGNLVNLCVLDLSYNNITCLPTSIEKLINLQYLILQEI